MSSADGDPSSSGGPRRGPTVQSDHRDRWVRVKSVFLEALDIPESGRTAFVEDACGSDMSLREEVLSLLASEQAAGSFGEIPATQLLGMESPEAMGSVPLLEPGTRLGPYEISGFLSAGGMGHVYRARHTVLDRAVAIKTVSSTSADPAARRRLLREARHASTLDHPNICTVYEVGDADGTPFIVMALVEGSSLSDLLRSGVPALEDALGHGVQIADALQHAHERGIVHRDLKSSNIVVDNLGRPIVLDFGLAKRLRREDGTPADSTITGHGALAGTLSYMAPEVLRGEPADARSDVWSLGVLLYELATGTLPFTGQTAFETSSAILGDPVRWAGRRVPLGLRLVIERCLVKGPAGRYQRAADVRAALEAIRRRRAWPLIGRLLVSTRRRTLYALGGSAALLVGLFSGGPYLADQLGMGARGRISTLALLPIENATENPAVEYYAAGLTEALDAQLGAAADIRLLSPASAARLARTAESPADVARALSADAIVTGRLRRASERIIVDVRVIERSRGRVLWSDTFDRGAQQVLALQADIVRALLAEVRLAVRPEARDRLGTVRAVNPEAYEAYLKGRYEWNQRTQPSLERAIAHFTEAISLDPTYAPSHAALADCYNQFGTVMVGTGSPREYRPRAAAAAIRALQIDPYSAEAHAALGYVRHYEWRWEEAEESFRRAIELNPSHALARIWYANLLMSRGRMEEALEQVFAARELDPYSLIINSNVGWVLSVAGRAEEAVEHMEWTLQLDSTYAQARSRLVQALMVAGRYSEAHAQAERLVALTDRSPLALAWLAQAAVRTGRTEEARAFVGEVMARADESYVPPFAIATLLAAVGDIDGAVAWMTKAFDEGSNGISYLATDPLGGPLQQDARIQDLIARAGLR